MSTAVPDRLTPLVPLLGGDEVTVAGEVFGAHSGDKWSERHPPKVVDSAECLIRGNIATNNAGAQRCLDYGFTRSHVRGLMLADGRVPRTNRFFPPSAVSGASSQNQIPGSEPRVLPMS